MRPAANVIVLSSSPDATASHPSRKVDENLCELSLKFSSPSKRFDIGCAGFGIDTIKPAPGENRSIKGSKSTPVNVGISTTGSKQNDKGLGAGNESKDIVQAGAAAAEEGASKWGKSTSKTKDSKVTSGTKRGGRPRSKHLAVGKVDNEQNKKQDSGVRNEASHSSGARLSRQNTPSGLENTENQSLQLDAASKRRLDWTPPKDTTSFKDITEPGSGHEEGGDSQMGAKPRAFSNMLSDYCFDGDVASRDVDVGEYNGLVKRRRLEVSLCLLQFILVLFFFFFFFFIFVI